MQSKTTYNRALFASISKSQKTSEQLIQEILSKACPLHGLHANIQISSDWDITTVTCCEDLSKVTNNVIHHFISHAEKSENNPVLAVAKD